jgi:hypothetical protein
VQGNGGEKASSREGSDEGGAGVKLSRKIPCKVTEVIRHPAGKDLMKVERARNSYLRHPVST